MLRIQNIITNNAYTILIYESFFVPNISLVEAQSRILSYVSSVRGDLKLINDSRMDSFTNSDLTLGFCRNKPEPKRAFYFTLNSTGTLGINITCYLLIDNQLYLQNYDYPDAQMFFRDVQKCLTPQVVPVQSVVPAKKVIPVQKAAPKRQVVKKASSTKVKQPKQSKKEPAKKLDRTGFLLTVGGVAVITLVIVGLAALIASPFLLPDDNDSSSEDVNSFTYVEDKEECPICGRLTSEYDLMWHGMCDRCYKNYKTLKNTYDELAYEYGL